MFRHWKIILPVVVLVAIVSVGIAVWSGWFSLSGQQAQSPSAQGALPLPSREEETALVNRTMGDFARALTQKDFAGFYGNISAIWQRQTTPEKIAQAFAGFMPFGREVQKSITSGLPTFNAQPSIDEKNILTLQGFYRIEATKMLFNLKYAREGDAWKLLGMDLSVK
ncbi:MAG TPA: hypothetical protein DEB30_04620 [Candidatus Peribacter riflensis]|uniref:DUF4864 domain-containing protein n=1 Tax=Candidatus Peribacter riflensis TaxID=1735162 RepID=A0A0S1SUF0_9BACT|nr:MAG: Uncharacterized protein PeribacterA2_0879 [Candidatus Peribacter riflensis]OGJ79183.1 MAG: hypothetical protein A2398_03340 [Candidatus Peribacteria bacterium RIFOXYB1_FULL_57_12]ALM11344.1 MAG: Uncharacterized protein PeribacterB2_0881 [Candidatus Peribacter riflensis]ALM12446.1 MAG: Uncharacterized protein PeribacterC2_0880 [Candidatus Peribacter riflensis]ALM13547.1 MAG: Uncharacterized protein PeribacterD1_0879 [Candidatus Peribacter riflensis]